MKQSEGNMRGLSTVKWIAKHPLTKGKRAQNIARFLEWQMRSRLIRKPHMYETANGAKMWAIPGTTGATGHLYVGLQEFEEMAFLLHFLRRGDLFADVGANVGLYTILAAVAIGTDVVAFEPGESATWLISNIELNGVADRVEVRREAVGAKSGIVFFTSGLDTMNHITADGTNAVPITTLDMACKTIPSLIKIDVEGFEADVLRGSRNILGNSAAQAVIMELNDEAATELLKGFRFTYCSYQPFKRELNTREVLASDNGIFVRSIDSAQRRLREAPAFSIHGRVI
jgi:FkbM family methyltransferase